MKFFNIFAVFMVMVLSVLADDETSRACPATQVTFQQCINQYGGYNPTETTCASKASLGDEYHRCLALAYYNLLQCFNHCPNHSQKSAYEQYFQQYQQYYTAVTAVETPTGALGTNTNANGATPTSFDLAADANGASSMFNAFSLGAVLCMVAYWLF